MEGLKRSIGCKAHLGSESSILERGAKQWCWHLWAQRRNSDLCRGTSGSQCRYLWGRGQWISSCKWWKNCKQGRLLLWKDTVVTGSVSVMTAVCVTCCWVGSTLWQPYEWVMSTMSCPQQPCSAAVMHAHGFYGVSPSHTWSSSFPTDFHFFPALLFFSKEPFLPMMCWK